MMIPAAEWMPDTAPLTPGSEVALNVLPLADGYGPLPTPVYQGPGGLPGSCSLLMAMISGDGVSIPFAFTSSGIYRAQATSWASAGREDGYLSRPCGWQAVQWGDTCFAVNGIDSIQMLQGATFDSIPGRIDGLGSLYIAVVGDFLVLANVYKFGRNEWWPARVWWSGRLRPTMLDPDIVIQSGFVDRPSIGRLQGITGGEYGLLLGEEGLDRMDYVGPPSIWQFRTLETDVGCEIPRSIVQAGDKTFWWSRRGWRMSRGGPSQPIGLGKVDAWTRQRVDMSRMDRMTATALLREGAVVWSFVSRDNAGTTPDEALIFSWEHNRWTRGRFPVTCLGRHSVPSLMTDDPASAAAFGAYTDASSAMTDAGSGGRPFAAAIVDGALHALQPKPGTICEVASTEVQLLPGQRALVSRLRPLIHAAGDDVWAFSATRETQISDRLRTKGPYEPERDGSMSLHHAGLYHRFRLRARVPFSKIQGVEVPDWAISPGGRR